MKALGRMRGPKSLIMQQNWVHGMLWLYFVTDTYIHFALYKFLFIRNHHDIFNLQLLYKCTEVCKIVTGKPLMENNSHLTSVPRNDIAVTVYILFSPHSPVQYDHFKDLVAAEVATHYDLLKDSEEWPLF